MPEAELFLLFVRAALDEWIQRLGLQKEWALVSG